MLLAEIASGEVDWADVFFLIAVILFILGAVGHVARDNLVRASYGLLCAGLACVSMGLLLL